MSLTAQELRIGNWIEWEDDSHDQFQVEQIRYVEPNYFINGGLIDDMLPIPLSEEWLIKFGFKRQGKRDMWIRDKVAVLWHDGSGLLPEGFYIAFKDMGNVIYHTQLECKFVHTLQNAFSLTGNDLTIKE